MQRKPFTHQRILSLLCVDLLFGLPLISCKAITSIQATSLIRQGVQELGKGELEQALADFN